MTGFFRKRARTIQSGVSALALLLGACAHGGAPTFTARAGCEAATFRDHSYALCRDRKVPFPDARKDCEGMGMQLIRLDSAAESDWIYRAFYEKKGVAGPDVDQMWVGATDRVEEGTWRWLIDDKVFWEGNAEGRAPRGHYTNWGHANGTGPQTQPNDAHPEQGEDCMVIRAPWRNENGHWTDIDCGAENTPPVTKARYAWYTCESL